MTWQRLPPLRFFQIDNRRYREFRVLYGNPDGTAMVRFRDGTKAKVRLEEDPRCR